LFDASQSERYYDALEKFDEGNGTPFTEFLWQATEDILDKYKQALTPKKLCGMQ
jgi:hypothetical protein